MRLSHSLALWIIGLSSAALAVHGWAELIEEENDLYAAVSRELTLVATAVRSAVENAVRDHQEADIGTLLEQLELRDPVFDVFVFRGDTVLLGSSRGSEPNLPRARSLAQESRASDGLQIKHLQRGDMVALTPFRAGGRVAGQIVILRPPNSVELDLREERNAILVSIAVLVATVSAAIWLVLTFRLQRPIAQIIEVVHQVAKGDLSVRIQRSGPDELGALARELDEMMDALERAREQLAKEAEIRERLEGEMLRANRLAVVGELAATLAHEVGSPLQVLGGRAQDITSRGDIPAEVCRSAGIIVEQVERIHNIVERFLDVARRKVPIVKDVNLDIAVREVADLLASQYRRKGVRLEVTAPSECMIRADPAQLQQVLLNLLQNALRASHRDATVRVQVASSCFKRTPEGAAQPSVAVTVTDEGPGIPDDAGELIFQPFYSAWRTDSEHIAGTGLGLSVVRTIMTDHGGTIEARPRSGGGACFVAHFPTQAEHAAVREVRT